MIQLSLKSKIFMLQLPPEDNQRCRIMKMCDLKLGMVGLTLSFSMGCDERIAHLLHRFTGLGKYVYM